MAESQLNLHSSAVLANLDLPTLPVTASPVETAASAAADHITTIQARDANETSIEVLEARGRPPIVKLLQDIDIQNAVKVIDDFNAAVDDARSKAVEKGLSISATPLPDLNHRLPWTSEIDDVQEALGRLRSRVLTSRHGQADVEGLERLSTGLGDNYRHMATQLNRFKRIEAYSRDPEAVRAASRHYNRDRKRKLKELMSPETLPLVMPTTLQESIEILTRFGSIKRARSTDRELEAARIIVASGAFPKRSDGRPITQLKGPLLSGDFDDAHKVALRVLWNKTKRNRRRDRERKAAKLAPVNSPETFLSSPRVTAPVSSTPSPPLGQQAAPTMLKNWPVLDLNKSPDRFV